MSWLYGYAAASLSMFVLTLGFCLMDRELRRETEWWLLILVAIVAGIAWPLTIAVGAWRDLRGRS